MARAADAGDLPVMEMGVVQAMLVWIAAGAAAGLTVFALRSMAYAFGASLGPARHETMFLFSAKAREQGVERRLGRGEVWMLLLEILFSVAMTMMIIALAYAAALPGHLIVGALLAQFVVIGAVLAPSVTHTILGTDIRPAALALGIAQIAHVGFFIRAIQAMLG
ncbi:MAG: hypothetical protein ACOC9Y_00965 [Chloroflexota bacterium]